MPKMHQNTCGRAPPGPAGGLKRSQTLSRNQGVPTSKRRQRRGKEEEGKEGREGTVVPLTFNLGSASATPSTHSVSWLGAFGTSNVSTPLFTAGDATVYMYSGMDL